ncbi:MAG TPA: FKBP-type peptidyl-prolyl cis-trans isomerase [Balneolaceae bacterium]|nr:FKBP-type peptidyl-prolyl cis-trans isomerase [Balneolaceae bacterium]
MKKYSLLLFLLPITVFLYSCKGKDPFRVDYSQVPPPFNSSEAVRDSVLPEGVKIYVTEEGDGQFEVTFKDAILVKYTGRTEDGDIFQSSYGRHSKKQTNFTDLLQNLYPYAIRIGNQNIPPQIEGFRKGLLGMRPGEKRIIVVPPEMGSSQEIRSGISLEGKTLIYDVELIQIAGVPRDEVDF